MTFFTSALLASILLFSHPVRARNNTPYPYTHFFGQGSPSRCEKAVRANRDTAFVLCHESPAYSGAGPSASHPWILKFETSFGFQKSWAINQSHDEGIVISDLKIDHQGNLILAGTVDETKSRFPVVLKYDQNGTRLWKYIGRSIDGLKTYNWGSVSIALDSQDTIFIFGSYLQKYNGWESDPYAKYSRSYVLKLDSKGMHSDVVGIHLADPGYGTLSGTILLNEFGCPVITGYGYRASGKGAYWLHQVPYHFCEGWKLELSSSPTHFTGYQVTLLEDKTTKENLLVLVGSKSNSTSQPNIFLVVSQDGKIRSTQETSSYRGLGGLSYDPHHKGIFLFAYDKISDPSLRRQILESYELHQHQLVLKSAKDINQNYSFSGALAMDQNGVLLYGALANHGYNASENPGAILVDYLASILL